MRCSGGGVREEDLHEEEPRDMTIGISVQNLVKIYDDVGFTHITGFSNENVLHNNSVQ